MPTATVRANAQALPDDMSPADQRALGLWRRWRKQYERRDRRGVMTESQSEAAYYKTLFAIENKLRLDIHASVVALAVILMIEIDREAGVEDVPGLLQASLTAIRPQLVGIIAEDIDRALASVKAGGGAVDAIYRRRTDEEAPQ
jgi:hypothetical protein